MHHSNTQSLDLDSDDSFVLSATALVTQWLIDSFGPGDIPKPPVWDWEFLPWNPWSSSSWISER